MVLSVKCQEGTEMWRGISPPADSGCGEAS